MPTPRKREKTSEGNEPVEGHDLEVQIFIFNRPPTSKCEAGPYDFLKSELRLHIGSS